MIKKRIILAAVLTVTWIYAEAPKETVEIEEKYTHKLHWSYEGETSPEHWAEIDKNFFLCKEGSNQSPINLAGFIEAELTPIEFNYHLSATEIVNNGHTEQVNVKKGSSITLDGTVFHLKQFHFHTPSENHINGKEYPLEAHFVHLSDNGTLAVVAVMFEEGPENVGLEELWKVMPTKEGGHHKVEAKHLNTLLPKNRDYYRFNGSLTTPPCSEGVRWLMMKNTVTLSKDEIKAFKNVVHLHNNRPIQATNARVILK